MHKFGIALLLGLSSFVAGNITFGLQSQWQPFKSCIEMTTTLSQYVKTDFSPSSPMEQPPEISTPPSQSFFSSFDKKK